MEKLRGADGKDGNDQRREADNGRDEAVSAIAVDARRYRICIRALRHLCSQSMIAHPNYFTFA